MYVILFWMCDVLLSIIPVIKSNIRSNWFMTQLISHTNNYIPKALGSYEPSRKTPQA